MSIKLYRAFKLRRASYLWPLVHDIRIKATKNIQEELESIYNTFRVTEEEKPRYIELLAERNGDTARASRAVIHERVEREYKASSVSSIRSVYDFNVSVVFRQFEGGIFLIPYCDSQMRKVLDFLDSDPRLRDYHYQNQTDRPDHISQRQWRERARVWNGMEEADQFRDVLTLDICSWDNFWAIDPWYNPRKSR